MSIESFFQCRVSFLLYYLNHGIKNKVSVHNSAAEEEGGETETSVVLLQLLPLLQIKTIDLDTLSLLNLQLNVSSNNGVYLKREMEKEDDMITARVESLQRALVK